MSLAMALADLDAQPMLGRFLMAPLEVMPSAALAEVFVALYLMCGGRAAAAVLACAVSTGEELHEARTRGRVDLA